jgi:hypothetical protein
LLYVCRLHRMNTRKLIGLALLVALAGCVNYDQRLTSKNTQYLGVGSEIVARSKASTLAEANSYWDGDGVQGAPSVVINLTEQTASFYKGGRLVGVSAISSGREGHDSPVGKFKIIDKDIDHASNLYGDYVDAQGKVVKANIDIKVDPVPPGAHFDGAKMPYFMHFAPGVGMHQGFLPGVPDSHGCIRMPEQMAKIYFANVQKGTPVEVVLR